MNELKAIKVSKMTDDYAGTERVKKSEIGIRKREEMGIVMKTISGERWISGD